MRLNLGAGDRRIEGYQSVDLAQPTDIVADLTQRWPWEDSSVEQVLAYDIFEHLPDRIFTMNELHRVLKPGGEAVIEVPSASHGAGFAQDPTHKSAWCLNSFQYYQEGSLAIHRFATSYGITARFLIVSLGETQHPDVIEPVWKIKAVLKAVK